AEDYGIYRIFMDGKSIADFDQKDWLKTCDFYAEGLKVADFFVGSLTLAKGKHTLRLEAAGRNPDSKGMLLGLDSVRLRQRWLKKRPSLRAK
ncbi:MAG: hypothetical protein AB1715_08580, partial [Acidobacteriota bacterium]